jgi:hypothetical protein
LKKPKNRKCIQYPCEESQYYIRLCEKHYKDKCKKDADHNAAVDLLHFGYVDGSYLSSSFLSDKLYKIRKWWFRACDSVNNSTVDSILLDEASNAIYWCISLAHEIVRSEREYRNNITIGEELESSLKNTENLVFERFRNLENGLMSNGLPRHKSR